MLDAQGDSDAQFIFQADVIVHFEGTNVTLLNSTVISGQTTMKR